MNADAIRAYCHRIDAPRAATPDLRTLRTLHRAHMLAVPLDTVDLYEGRGVTLAEDAFYEKVVGRRGGGVCIELNGLLAALLRAVGYEVSLLAAAVALRDGRYSEDFAHNLLLVGANGEGWLADVGYAGQSPLLPLRMASGAQRQGAWTYTVASGEDGHTVRRRGAAGTWEPMYRFTTRPRRLEDFREVAERHRTDPASPFQQRRVVARATLDGKVVVSGDRVTISAGGRERSRVVANAAEREALLERVLRAPRLAVSCEGDP